MQTKHYFIVVSDVADHGSSCSITVFLKFTDEKVSTNGSFPLYIEKSMVRARVYNMDSQQRKMIKSPKFVRLLVKP